MRYWCWFLKYGYKGIINKWLVIHFVVGISLAMLSGNNLKEISIAVIFPVSGMLLSVCMAWSGAFSALINTPEILQLIEKIKTPDRDVKYIYSYQTSVLVLVSTTVIWAIMAIIGQTVENAIIMHCYYEDIAFLSIKTAIFSTSSIAVRETWGITKYANSLQVAKTKISGHNKKNNT